MIALIVGVILAVAFAAVAVYQYDKSNKKTAYGLAFLSVVILCLGFAAMPFIGVWQAHMTGKAEMARAEINRQIKVREAQALKDSAVLTAEAEVARARGVAEANKIVQDGLGGPEGYLRYLFIESLKEARGDGAQVIYVPTEAGLPILEAGRLGK